MTELTKVRDALAGVLGGDAVNQLGRETGQAQRLRTVTPHRLFLAIVSALAGAPVESLADVLRTFNDQNGVQVAYKAFYNRLARIATLAPEGERAVVCRQAGAARGLSGPVHDHRAGGGGDPRDLQWVCRRGATAPRGARRDRGTAISARIDLVGDFLWGRKTNKDGQRGDAKQIQWGTNFRF